MQDKVTPNQLQTTICDDFSALDAVLDNEFELPVFSDSEIEEFHNYVIGCSNNNLC